MRIIYNGIDLQLLDIQEAVCQPVYDDSQTDVLYCMYKISGNAMVNGLASVQQGSTSSTPVPGQTTLGPALSLATLLPNDIPGNSKNQWTLQKEYSPPAATIAVTDNPTDINITDLGKTVLGSTDGATFPAGVAAAPVISSCSTRKGIEVIQNAGPSAITLNLLYSKLNEPRAQLWVFTDNGGTNDLVIRSHSNTQICDCKNGPIPNATNIVKAFGDGATYFLNFQVTTYVDLRIHPAGETTDHTFLLSNRFTTQHVINEDSFLAITVQGVAVGRTDIMYEEKKSLDSLRKSLFLPVPGGFVRTNINVVGSPDNTRLYYTYTDIQQPVNFVAGRYENATQIEAVHRQSLEMSGSDLGKTAIDLYDRVNTLRTNNLWRRQLEDDAKAKALAHGSPPPSGPSGRPTKAAKVAARASAPVRYRKPNPPPAAAPPAP